VVASWETAYVRVIGRSSGVRHGAGQVVSANHARRASVNGFFREPCKRLVAGPSYDRRAMADRPSRPLTDTVWWWTVVTLLVMYAVAWIDEQPGFAQKAVPHSIWALALVWPVVIGAGVLAGRAEGRGSAWAWAVWPVAGLWTLVVGGVLVFFDGDLGKLTYADPRYVADSATRLAVGATIGLGWAAAEWFSVSIRRSAADDLDEIEVVGEADASG
jgi:hypothetical protein